MNNSLQFRVLANENQDDFDTLLAAMMAEFQPATEHQKFLVELMAQSRWRLRRIQRIETAAFDQMLSAPAAEKNPDGLLAIRMFANPGAFSMLQRLAVAAERTYHKAHAELVKSRQAQNEAKAVEHLDAAIADTAISNLVKRVVTAPVPKKPNEPKFLMASAENLAPRL